MNLRKALLLSLLLSWSCKQQHPSTPSTAPANASASVQQPSTKPINPARIEKIVILGNPTPASSSGLNLISTDASIGIEAGLGAGAAAAVAGALGYKFMKGRAKEEKPPPKGEPGGKELKPPVRESKAPAKAADKTPEDRSASFSHPSPGHPDANVHFAGSEIPIGGHDVPVVHEALDSPTLGKDLTPVQPNGVVATVGSPEAINSAIGATKDANHAVEVTLLNGDKVLVPKAPPIPDTLPPPPPGHSAPPIPDTLPPPPPTGHAATEMPPPIPNTLPPPPVHSAPPKELPPPLPGTPEPPTLPAPFWNVSRKISVHTLTPDKDRPDWKLVTTFSSEPLEKDSLLAAGKTEKDLKKEGYVSVEKEEHLTQADKDQLCEGLARNTMPFANITEITKSTEEKWTMKIDDQLFEVDISKNVVSDGEGHPWVKYTASAPRPASP